MSDPVSVPPSRTTDPIVRVALVVLGAVNLLVGVVMAAVPGFFYDFIGSFGERDVHGIHSYATWTLALSAALFIALSRPSWQVPVLFVAALQGGLHTVASLVDMGAAEPSFYGPVTAVVVFLPTLLALWALWRFLRYPLS